jgi:hypothetical protein
MSGYFLLASKDGGFTTQPMTFALPVDGYVISSILASCFPCSTSPFTSVIFRICPRLLQVDDDDVLRVIEVGRDARGDEILRHRIERQHLPPGGDRLHAADDRRELHVAAHRCCRRRSRVRCRPAPSAC